MLSQTKAQEQYSNELSIDQLAFFAGHWSGDVLGGIGEEAWMPPAGGAMIGSFRHVANDKMTFSEFFIIQETEQDIIFRFKHFNNDYTTWEDAKSEPPMEFKLVSVENNTATFNGMGKQSNEYLVYQLKDDGRLIIKLAPHDKNDSEKGFELYFDRVN